MSQFLGLDLKYIRSSSDMCHWVQTRNLLQIRRGFVVSVVHCSRTSESIKQGNKSFFKPIYSQRTFHSTLRLDLDDRIWNDCIGGGNASFPRVKYVVNKNEASANISQNKCAIMLFFPGDSLTVTVRLEEVERGLHNMVGDCEHWNYARAV